MNNYITSKYEWQVSYIAAIPEIKTYTRYPRTVTWTWEMFQIYFGNVREFAEKEFAPMFSTALFKEGEPKTKENVLNSQLAPFDFDHHDFDRESLKKVVVNNGWQAVIYTTFNHTKAVPRFRVILFPNRTTSTEEWDKIWQSINYWAFKGQCCSKARNVGNLFYFPSKPIGSDEGHFVEFIEGDLLDVDRPYCPPRPGRR